MNICPDILNELDAYAAGTLSAAEQAAVEAHLRECPACREEAENIRETRAILKRELVPAPLPGDFAAGVLAKLHATNTSARIKNNPRYQALSQPLSGQVKSNWKRHISVAAVSLLLNAAAAVVVIALALKLNAAGDSVHVRTAPQVADLPASREYTVSFKNQAIALRESRPAILLSGVRAADGAVQVNVAQFVEDAVLTLRRDDGLGCLKAFFPAAKAQGTECRVSKATLRIPEALAGIFGDDLQMRIIEMEDCLEIWPRARWQKASGQAVARAPRADDAPALACATAPKPDAF